MVFHFFNGFKYLHSADILHSALLFLSPLLKDLVLSELDVTKEKHPVVLADGMQQQTYSTTSDVRYVF